MKTARRRLSQRRVAQLTGGMAVRRVRRSGKRYRDGSLAPIAERVEALPEGGKDDDDEVNAAHLQGLLKSLDASLLGAMDTDGLAEEIAAHGLQAEMIGRAAAEGEVGSEK